MDTKEKLEGQLQKLDELLGTEASSPKFKIWDSITSNLLNDCPQLTPELVSTFTKIPLTQSYMSKKESQRLFRSYLQKKKEALTALMELL